MYVRKAASEEIVYNALGLVDVLLIGFWRSSGGFLRRCHGSGRVAVTILLAWRRLERRRPPSFRRILEPLELDSSHFTAFQPHAQLITVRMPTKLPTGPILNTTLLGLGLVPIILHRIFWDLLRAWRIALRCFPLGEGCSPFVSPPRTLSPASI